MMLAIKQRTSDYKAKDGYIQAPPTCVAMAPEPRGSLRLETRALSVADVYRRVRTASAAMASILPVLFLDPWSSTLLHLDTAATAGVIIKFSGCYFYLGCLFLPHG